MDFDKINHAVLKEKLQYPNGKLRLVIDTDAYNEVDDQFAISWACASPERFTLEAVYAAPYCSKALLKAIPVDEETLKRLLHWAGTAEEGMEKSYKEILHLLSLMNINTENKVFRGSTQYLESLDKPIESPAAQDLVKRAMAGTEPLYVIAIGCPTNVASALLMEPKIRDKIVVVWLGGQPPHWSHAVEFNLMQDILASQVLLDSGVPLVLIPCITCASQLTVTKEEMEGRLIGKSKIGDYLAQIVLENFKDKSIAGSDLFLKMAYIRDMDDIPMDIAQKYTIQDISWSRIIWDISTVGFLMNPNWTASKISPAPILTDDIRWEHDENRHPIRLVHYVSRDHIFGDLFGKLSRLTKT
ncbi:MAG: nucleoside hydrolase [Spirochaetaceae bacterium]|jgi:inosine-uridine nucleoside N-ribohydrolase|nr:nucleoside hydrolase [Spirochaetaceae bacterium]